MGFCFFGIFCSLADKQKIFYDINKQKDKTEDKRKGGVIMGDTRWSHEDIAAGYEEMAQLNLEIAAEFALLEEEAFARARECLK